MKNLEKYRKDLQNLIVLGELMNTDLGLRDSTGNEYDTLKNQKNKEVLGKIKWVFEGNYQEWYTVSISLIRQLIPDRLNEFISLYQPDLKRRKIDSMTYTIHDWLNGTRSAVSNWDGAKFFKDFIIIQSKFQMQYQILKSAEKRFKNSLFDIQQLVQADILDSEVEVAKELQKRGFLRSAGVICGVVIEKHLKQVCENHQIKIRKKHPTISDFNENLKNNNVIEVSTWRQIQHLADIRNKCGHDKGVEPIKEEIEDIIRGTEKIIKTIF